MLIREIRKSDLDGLQELYLHLHENAKLPETAEHISLLDEIIADKNYYILVGEIEGKSFILNRFYRIEYIANVHELRSKQLPGG